MQLSVFESYYCPVFLPILGVVSLILAILWVDCAILLWVFVFVFLMWRVAYLFGYIYCYSDFLFCELSFPIFCSFFIWVVFFLTGFMKVYARHEFFVGHYFRIIFFQFIFSLFVLPLCAEFLHFIALKIVHLTIKM